MQGLKIQCPNCKRKDFVTTEKFNPDVTPNGSMVKCLLPYQIDWLCSSTTLASEMTCPECLAQLVIDGRLTVLVPIRDVGDFFNFVTAEVAAAKKMNGTALKVTTNELQVPIRDDSPQAHMDGDKLNIVDPKNITIPGDLFSFFVAPMLKTTKEPKKKQSKKKSHK